MHHTSQRALLIIDPQNDYFPGGKFPLWNMDAALSNVLRAIDKAQQAGDAIILVQHVADPAQGIAPFFNQGSEGAEIHRQILEAAPNAPVVVKHFADSFEQTALSDVLTEQGIKELVLCGMMTQNCITHTALSKSADNYQVSILADSCTTVDEMIHNIALHALSPRVPLTTIDATWSAA